MNEFVKDNKYYFIGSPLLIQNMISNDMTNGNKIYLGKFIEYIGMPLHGDWLFNGKAQFEFGILSLGYRLKV